jgi:hypothetical protein
MRTDKIIKEANNEKLLSLLNCVINGRCHFTNPDDIISKIIAALINRNIDLSNLYDEYNLIKSEGFFKIENQQLLEDKSRVLITSDIGRSFLFNLELQGPSNDRVGQAFVRN